jgi:hypothetical protein
MKTVGEKLNLKEHFAGLGRQRKNIFGPTDMEIHKTKDGRYFVWYSHLFRMYTNSQ